MGIKFKELSENQKKIFFYRLLISATISFVPLFVWGFFIIRATDRFLIVEADPVQTLINLIGFVTVSLIYTLIYLLYSMASNNGTVLIDSIFNKFNLYTKIDLEKTQLKLEKIQKSLKD